MNSLPKTDSTIAILLIGYNRPEFIRKRINELGDFTPHNLIVSIDGGCNPEVLKEFKEIESEISRSFENIEFLIHSENLGLVRHITGAISKVLKTHEYVIVIEDDVALSQNYVENILTAMTVNLGLSIATIGGFSPLKGIKGLTWLNRWRATKYFSAWGWCVSREFWSMYKHEIDERELFEGLRYSKIWNSLHFFNQATWMYRFKKVVANPLLTWDYQMQFLSFKLDLEHILPIFRISDNEGFSDSRSTNTKEPRPRWMGDQISTVGSIIRSSAPKVVSRFIENVDSLTIAGDSKIKKYFQRTRIRNSIRL